MQCTFFVILSGIAWYVDSSQKRSFAKDSRGISDIFLVLKELLKNSARATVEARQATPTLELLRNTGEDFQKNTECDAFHPDILNGFV
jgi:hypothetical protein